MNGRSTAGSALTGVAAGVAGGLAMSLIRMAVSSRLPERMRADEEFASRKAVEWSEQRAGRPDALGERAEAGAGMAAHLGYSGLAGSVYGLVRPFAERVPAPLLGAAHGLAVWAAGYEGWMPVLGVAERTTDKPVSRWIAPLLEHAAYGITTGIAYEMLRDEGPIARRRKIRRSIEQSRNSGFESDEEEWEAHRQLR